MGRHGVEKTESENFWTLFFHTVTLTKSLLLLRRYRSLHHSTIPDSGRRGSRVQDGCEQGWPAPVAEEEEREG